MSNVNRRENAKKNITISLVCQLITMVCGLITPRFMLRAFGSEANGAITSITTFLGYIMLLEGGIGGVARAALYKPLAENDHEKISQIMVEMKRFFRRVGCFFVLYVIVFACFFKEIAQTDALDWMTSFFLVIIISASTFAQYFIGISNSVLVIASQKQYINNTINLIGTVLNTILVVILTHLGCSLITVKLFSSFVFIAKPITLWLYVKRNFNVIRINSTKTLLKDKWTGLGQHIAYFLYSHTDVVVLTLFSDLKAVSVYSVYYLVTNSIQSIASSFSSGMEAVFGDMYAKKEIDGLHRAFTMYDTLVSMISVVLFGSTMVLIIPFVRLYTIDVTDTNYIHLLFGILLTIACLLHCLRTTYHNMIIAAGHFKQTNIASYGEAAINIVISILLVIKFGLVGVAIGTVTATLFRFSYYAIYLSKNILFRKIRLWIKRELINVSNLFLIYYVGNGIVDLFAINNYIIWVETAITIAIVSSVITILLNLCFYKEACSVLIKQLFRSPE